MVVLYTKYCTVLSVAGVFLGASRVFFYSRIAIGSGVRWYMFG